MTADLTAGIDYLDGVYNLVLSAEDLAGNTSTITLTLNTGTFSNGSKTVSVQAVNSIAPLRMKRSRKGDRLRRCRSRSIA